jgi:peptidyl-prolyl cis-trans isomerase B (cyclophilin B)
MRSIHLLAGVCAALLLGSCAASPAPSAPTSSSAATSVAATGATASGTATCAYPADGEAAKPATPPPAAEPKSGAVTATVALPGGSVTIALDRATTPCTVGSFVHLAQAGYFDDTRCHRLTTAGISVLQCGDPSGTGGGGPGYSFADETNAAMTYPAGTVAMANAGPDTNGSQFFLVYADSELSPDYTVFGHITAGLPVLTTIAAAGVQGGSSDGTPVAPATISKVTIAG